MDYKTIRNIINLNTKRNPFGGGGGGGGSSKIDQNIKYATVNPTIPDEAKPLADSMLAIATALQGAPVNFGAIPGFDAPATPNLPPSLGALLASTPFQQGANRINPVSGRGRVPMIGGGRTPIVNRTPGSPMNWGSLFSLRQPNSIGPIPRNQPTAV